MSTSVAMNPTNNHALVGVETPNTAMFQLVLPTNTPALAARSNNVVAMVANLTQNKAAHLPLLIATHQGEDANNASLANPALVTREPTVLREHKQDHATTVLGVLGAHAKHLLNTMAMEANTVVVLSVYKLQLAEAMEHFEPPSLKMEVAPSPTTHRLPSTAQQPENLISNTTTVGPSQQVLLLKLST